MRLFPSQEESSSSPSMESHKPSYSGGAAGRESSQSPVLPQFVERKGSCSLDRSASKQSIVERLPDTMRNHFIAMSGEFVGTVLFLFFALAGTQVANSVNTSSGLTIAEAGSNPQQLLYIAICFGFSLAVNAWTFFRISGGLFNPAVTLGLCLIGALPWLRGALLFITQILGGMAAAGLVSCMFPGPLNVGTTLNAGTSTAQGLFIEMFLTAQLVFTIFMLAAEKHRGTFMAPVGIGLSLFIAELTGVHWTGGSLNPARSFGPAVATRSFPGTHWIYWLGPLLGAVVAAGLFKLFKWLDYETANPGQDVDNAEHEAELKKRSTKRKDSVFSPGSSGTFWTGESAAAAAAAATPGECEACKIRSHHRRDTWDSGAPTVREAPNSLVRKFSPATMAVNDDFRLRAASNGSTVEHVEGLSQPTIVLTNPTPPPMTEHSNGRPNPLLPRLDTSTDAQGRDQVGEREWMRGQFA